MTAFVYWSFALALLPLVLDLLHRLSVLIGDRIAVLRKDLNAADSGVFFEIDAAASGEFWPARDCKLPRC